jgi:hypothetical protein
MHLRSQWRHHQRADYRSPRNELPRPQPLVPHGATRTCVFRLRRQPSPICRRQPTCRFISERPTLAQAPASHRHTVLIRTHKDTSVTDHVFRFAATRIAATQDIINDGREPHPRRQNVSNRATVAHPFWYPQRWIVFQVENASPGDGARSQGNPASRRTACADPEATTLWPRADARTSP